MRDLIARLEAAVGPDRELDVAVHLAVGRKPGRAVDDDGCEYDALASIPAYSDSLDAALSLVPEGWGWTLYSADDAGPPCAYCVPNMKRSPWPKDVTDHHGATPALALCAAALRAREAGDA